MAKAQQSLLKNSSSIENIKDSLNAFGVSLRKANSTSSTIVKSLYKGNRDKKRAMIKQRELFQRRREAVQKREQEDIIEAGKVGSVYRRTSKVISGSTKGFLGRVMDFVGTIMVGWLVNNLPRIIKGAQVLTERIQNLIGVLGSWTDGIGNFYLDFTAQLDGILGRNKNLYIDQDKKDADNSGKELEGGVNRMLQDMEQMITNLLGFDLLKILGLKEEAPGTDPTKLPTKDSPTEGGGTYGDSGDSGATSSSSGGGGNLKPLLDMISSGESPGGGYTAMFPSESHPQILGMTINEVIAFQKEKLKDGRRSAAIGRYQMLYPENYAKAAGIPLTAKFSPENQDKMVIAYLKKYRKLDLWLQGKISDAAFSEELAREFGTFKSASGFVLPNNTGSIGFEQMKPVFKKIKQGRTQQTTQTRQTGPAPKIDSGKRYRVGEDVSSTLGASAKITSIKGSRESFRSKDHGGIDIACDPNLYISLRADAEVVGTQRGGGYGNVIDIWVPSLGIQLRFAHNTRILISSGKIPAGTSFATTGYTGNVRPKGPQGSHIHLEADTKRGGTRYGGDTSPAPYVSLIRLTNAKIEGVKSRAPESRTGTGGPSLESIPTQTGVAEKVTPERRGKTLTVPMPMGGGAQPSAPAASAPEGGGKTISLGGGDQLNTFVTKTLLRELEYV